MSHISRPGMTVAYANELYMNIQGYRNRARSMFYSPCFGTCVSQCTCVHVKSCTLFPLYSYRVCQCYAVFMRTCACLEYYHWDWYTLCLTCCFDAIIDMIILVHTHIHIPTHTHKHAHTYTQALTCIAKSRDESTVAVGDATGHLHILSLCLPPS